MFDLFAGELGKAHQRELQDWAAQQRLAKRVRGETPAAGQRIRQATRALLAVAGRWLQPRKTLRDGSASRGLDY